MKTLRPENSEIVKNGVWNHDINDYSLVICRLFSFSCCRIQCLLSLGKHEVELPSSLRVLYSNKAEKHEMKQIW